MADITTACRDINQLNPLAQKACKLFMAECEKAGVKIFITETYRSQNRQNYLYAQGRTRAGSIVTYTTNSNHTGRMAWDIACSPPQKLYDASVLQKAGVIANKLGIRWGGSCFGTFIDNPHFEILASWKEPVVKAPVVKAPVVKEDKELANAVSTIIKKNVDIDFSIWKRTELFNVKFSKQLFEKIFKALFKKNTYREGIEYLVQKDVIDTPDIWINEKALKEPKYIRALLIKISDYIMR